MELLLIFFGEVVVPLIYCFNNSPLPLPSTPLPPAILEGGHSTSGHTKVLEANVYFTKDFIGDNIKAFTLHCAFPILQAKTPILFLQIFHFGCQLIHLPLWIL